MASKIQVRLFISKKISIKLLTVTVTVNYSVVTLNTMYSTITLDFHIHRVPLDWIPVYFSEDLKPYTGPQ